MDKFRPSYGYSDANIFLGKRDSRKLQNNTELHRTWSGDIAVKLWSTDVVTYHQDGAFTLATGGWGTVTKDRLNAYSPKGYVWSEKGEWWYNINSVTYEFRSGMRISSDGVPNTMPLHLILLGRKIGKVLDEAGAIDLISGLELVEVKRFMRNRYLAEYVLEHCRKEYVPAFIGREDLAPIIERRLSNGQGS